MCLIRLPLSRGTDEETGAQKHAALRLLLATLVLAAGYCVFEYRLFRLMLFSGTETIRSQMGSGAGGLPAALRSAWDVFWYGDMHTRSVHLYVVAPVCIFIITFISKRKINIPRLRLTLHVIAGMILFNSLMYGIDSFAPFRRLVAALFPALEGFQFGRFVFLNPFLWYLLFTLCICILPQKAGTLIALFACAVAVCMPVPYNDLYHSAHGIYYAMRHGGETPDKMNIGDFYAQDLFSRIKEDIDYDPEDYAVSYGLYPAVAEVNGISTLDGYLGYYPAAYKEAFRRVIAPALARSEASAAYFDGWGARCYLDNGTDESAGMQFRSLPGITDDILHADTGALKDLGCVYVFSRVRLSNAEALQMRLIRAYEDDAQPFHLYVYMLE